MLENVLVRQLEPSHCQKGISHGELLLTFLINGIHPSREDGGDGLRSCGRNAPKYVLGAYCRGNLVRRSRKIAKYAMEMMRVGTRVDTRPDSEGSLSLVEPTFSSSFGLVLGAWRTSRSVWREFMTEAAATQGEECAGHTTSATVAMDNGSCLEPEEREQAVV